MIIDSVVEHHMMTKNRKSNITLALIHVKLCLPFTPAPVKTFVPFGVLLVQSYKVEHSQAIALSLTRV